MSHTHLSLARRVALGTALAIGASMAAPAFAASNLMFMSNSPLAYMKKADNESLAKAANDVLTNKQDNETVDWTNTGTRNPVVITAQLTPTNTHKDDTRTCRDLIVLLGAKGQEVTLKLPACKKGDAGRWELQKRGTP
ncbi:MAG: RT0821/Lpp0805 family surface protein [Pandoraea sp.]|nr:RT0821/Lpp0805 family surface protein [Pandoraea sp.]MDR3399828.1 RT0821/Lpp0805 family surface protein [Pandoraea sp.]